MVNSRCGPTCSIDSITGSPVAEVATTACSTIAGATGSRSAGILASSQSVIMATVGAGMATTKLTGWTNSGCPPTSTTVQLGSSARVVNRASDRFSGRTTTRMSATSPIRVGIRMLRSSAAAEGVRLMPGRSSTPVPDPSAPSWPTARR